MKAILIAALAELVLFACVSALLRWDVTWQRARSMLIAFLSLLPALLAVHLLTRWDLGFLPAELVMPIAWIDLAFGCFSTASVSSAASFSSQSRRSRAIDRDGILLDQEVLETWSRRVTGWSSHIGRADGGV
jgi:hypothetical protein